MNTRDEHRAEIAVIPDRSCFLPSRRSFAATLHDQQWCLLATDGLHRSSDGGTTLERLLNETGTAGKPDAGKELR